MSEKWSFVKKIGKNLCAFVLAVGAVVSTIPGISLQMEAAETDYTIYMIRNNSAKYPENQKKLITTQMICNKDESISVEMDALPSSYAISDPPFTIYRKQADGSLVLDSGAFNISGSAKRYTLSPNAAHIGLEDGGREGFKEYTLRAAYTANGITQGIGVVSATGGPSLDDPPVTIPNFGETGVTVKSQSAMALVEDTASMKVTFTRQSDGSMTGEVTDLKGQFNSLYGGHTTTASYSQNGGICTVKVSLGDGTSPSNFDVSTTLGGKNITDYTKVSFTLTFTKPTVNPLVIQVYSPKGAIYTDVQALNGKYNAVQEDGSSPYLTLYKNDETPMEITGAVHVVTEVYRYNGKLGVEWAFQPDEGFDEYANSLSWKSPDQVMTYTEPAVTVPGHLVANFYYQPLHGPKIYLSDGKFEPGPGASLDNEGLAVIPVKILGRGVQPTVQLEGEYFARYDKPGDEVVRTKDYVKYPDNDPRKQATDLEMDLYDGEKEANIYLPYPESMVPYKLAPYRYDGTLHFGSGKNGAASVKITQSASQGSVRLVVDGEDYAWGSSYAINRENIDDPETRGFYIFPVEQGTVKLHFEYYNKKGQLMTNFTVRDLSIVVSDNRPSGDASLKALDMVPTLRALDPDNPVDKAMKDTFDGLYPTGMIDYGFQSQQLIYGSVTVPNLVEKIRLKPQYTEVRNFNTVSVLVQSQSINSVVNPKATGDDNMSQEINLEPGMPVTITVRCTAQNGEKQDYVLTVTRALKSTEAALENLIVRPKKNSPEEDYYTLTPDPFDPSFTDYRVTVPYYPGEVYVEAIAKNPWATSIDITSEQEEASLFAAIADAFKRKHGDTIQLHYDKDPSNGRVENVTKVTITVKAEDDSKQEQYTLHIKRDDPSDDATILAPEVSYWLSGNHREELPAELDEVFAPDDKVIYTKMVEYSTDRIKLKITPNDPRARSVTVTVNGTTVTKECPLGAKEAKTQEFIFDKIQWPADNSPLDFTVLISPESDAVAGSTPKNDPYHIMVERMEPSRDLTATVTLTNMLTNAAIDFGYTNVIDAYPEKEVEYTPGDMKVLVQVKPTDEKTSVKVQGNTPRPDGTAVSLTAGSTTTVTIELTAEDGSTRTITIPLKYKGPSNACYLSNLVAGGLKFLPDPTPFDKKKTSYKIEIPKGTTSIPVTPTLLKDGSRDDSSNATITIEGATVADGAAFNYQPTDKTGKITIVVTAQDGKTKRTYTITYKNWNLLIPNDEDLLKDLWVDYGDMQPEFSPTTTEYDVYVKPDAMELKVYPKLKDKDGDIEVTAESKVLTKFEDYYSTSLMDDDMDIHIYVWSEKAVVEAASSNAGADANADAKPARNVAREYILHVYRNDDEKIGNLKPITTDMVDFESADPIVIDITKYTVISAEVFNTLKTDYADKSILFKGNDYTLQVFGADIDGLVPNTDSFDLKFSFKTPDEDKILDLIDDAGRNDNIDPVYYYFNQHGALPGEMLLTVDLGRHYRNRDLFWNYYNQERERIDYYGYVHTNAKGTFSVPISHFSTYLSTEDKIRGAENKSDEYGNPALTPETENLNAPGSADKAIPNTGAGVTG